MNNNVVMFIIVFPIPWYFPISNAWKDPNIQLINDLKIISRVKSSVIIIVSSLHSSIIMIIIDKMVFNDAKITFKGNALPTYLGAESYQLKIWRTIWVWIPISSRIPKIAVKDIANPKIP